MHKGLGPLSICAVHWRWFSHCSLEIMIVQVIKLAMDHKEQQQLCVHVTCGPQHTENCHPDCLHPTAAGLYTGQRQSQLSCLLVRRQHQPATHSSPPIILTSHPSPPTAASLSHPMSSLLQSLSIPVTLLPVFSCRRRFSRLHLCACQCPIVLSLFGELLTS